MATLPVKGLLIHVSRKLEPAAVAPVVPRTVFRDFLPECLNGKAITAALRTGRPSKSPCVAMLPVGRRAANHAVTSAAGVAALSSISRGTPVIPVLLLPTSLTRPLLSPGETPRISLSPLTVLLPRFLLDPSAMRLLPTAFVLLLLAPGVIPLTSLPPLLLLPIMPVLVLPPSVTWLLLSPGVLPLLLHLVQSNGPTIKP